MVRPLCFSSADANYPPGLSERFGAATPQIHALGNLALLNVKPIALFCSRRCPGELIVKLCDLAQQWREAGVNVISGFHSPMERECLRILVRGQGGIIVCPARGLPKRIPVAWRSALDSGRMLIITPFDEKQRRMTTALSEIRNRFVAALAESVFIAYAAPASRTEVFAREIKQAGKGVTILDRDSASQSQCRARTDIRIRTNGPPSASATPPARRRTGRFRSTRRR